MMKHEIIICKCESVEHQIVFSYFPDEEDDDDKDVYMSVYLLPESNIFKRIWLAIQYIFGHRSIYGDFDEVIINQRDAPKLEKILKHLKDDTIK